MLPSEEEKKFPIFCPRCDSKVDPGDFGWLGIFDDLSQFGKTVLLCPNCKKWFVIRDEGEGPFATK